MYHPYLRGKQFELLTIREQASVLARSDFVPIIEPVKQSLNGLRRALQAICDAGGHAVVVVNPYFGDHRSGGEDISYLLKTFDAPKNSLSVGILLRENCSLADAERIYKEHAQHSLTLVHAGFTEGKALSEQLGSNLKDTRNVFFEAHCGKLYRKHFQGSTRALLRDGFRRRRNADHPELEEFSDLHVTFKEEDMDGFGDFLIVGDDYNEGGGPAYAVAIHLTFIDITKENEMYIYHFVSTTQDTPVNPAGKFAEALQKLIDKVNSPNSKLLETSAIKEFRQLHKKGHFPGLGYVKKLSMSHHIETLSAYFGQ